MLYYDNCRLQSGFITNVVAGGDMTIGLLSTPSDNLTAALRDVAYRLWCSHVQLEQVLRSFIRPLLSHRECALAYFTTFRVVYCSEV